MVLKKFFGKTLEAVKKSARQMYGDDFIILDSSPPGENRKAGLTIMTGGRAKANGAGDASGRSADAGSTGDAGSFSAGSSSAGMSSENTPSDAGTLSSAGRSTAGTSFVASKKSALNGRSGAERRAEGGSSVNGSADDSSSVNGSGKKTAIDSADKEEDTGPGRSRTGTATSGKRSNSKGTPFKAGRTRHMKRDKLGRFVKQDRTSDSKPSSDSRSKSKSESKSGSGSKSGAVSKSGSSSNLDALRKYAEQLDEQQGVKTGDRQGKQKHLKADDHQDAKQTMKGGAQQDNRHDTEQDGDLHGKQGAEIDTQSIKQKQTAFTPGTYSRASIRRKNLNHGAGESNSTVENSGTAEIPVENPTENTVKSPVENPAENTVKSPVENPTENTVKSPVESPAEQRDPQESRRSAWSHETIENPKTTENHISESEESTADRPDLNPSQPFKPRNLQAHSSPTDPALSASRRERQEVAALHSRFDRLEKLLGSSLISSNFDYVSHPAFQQLVQTGISTSVIARWFSDIIKQGVDPYDQPETFMVKLSGIIREAINRPAEGDPLKYLLFTGPSGSGKTHLIMKLVLHDEFMAGKKVGVISLLPQGKESEFYYTVMEPFCKERSIPWYPVRSGKEVTQRLEEWEAFDHLLIDTPSVSTEQDHSFRQYWKLRQLVTPLAPLEVHYVVNAALSRFYFQQSLASHHPMLPDYVAITHLDEISQWGPIIPFLDEMGCAARYVSTGSSVPHSLKAFNPAWFAQQVLDEQ